MRIACGTNIVARTILLAAMLALAIFWLAPGSLLAAGAGQESQPAEAPAVDFRQAAPAAPLLDAELKETTSLFLAIVKAMAALAVVLGLLVLTAKWLKKMGWGGSDRPGSGSLIKVLETRMLAPKKYVAIVQVGRELMVVGVTEQQINLLAKLEQPDSLLEELAAGQAGEARLNGSFAAKLRKACGGTPERKC